MKLKWRVSEANTGPYKSFHYRAWPYCEKPDGGALFHISCDDSYVPAYAKSGNHSPLKVRVAVYNKRVKGFDWRTLKGEFKTLDDAKFAALSFYTANPHVFENVKQE